MNQEARADRTKLAITPPPETRGVALPSRSLQAVVPQGWRRTDQGWEHVSTWPTLPRPLGEIIRHQQDREPVWIQFVLGTLREVPPLAFALLQIAVIASIVILAKKRKFA